jgi:hypothetical protein
MSGAAALAAAFPFPAAAYGDQFDVLLLICTNPRIWLPTVAYMKARELEGQYRPFAILGAAIGIVAEQYKNSPFREQFWNELTDAVTWHKTRRIIALDHRDCEAARVAYGLTETSDALLETEMHRYALAEFRDRVADRHPDLDVEIGLLSLNGMVTMLR